MKRILLWSYSDYDWPIWLDTLKEFFSAEDVEIIPRCFLSTPNEHYQDIDLALIVSSEWFYFVKTLIAEDTPIILLKYTIESELFEELRTIIGRGGEISLVADTQFYAEERQRMLSQLGLPERSMKLWYRGLSEDELRETVLIYEWAGLTKKEGHYYIDIHGRGPISTETLVQIAMTLDMLGLLETEFYRLYKERVMHTTYHFYDMMEMGERYALVRRKSANGLVWFMPDGRICYFNCNASTMLGIPVADVVGHKITDVFPFLREWMEKLDEFGEQVVSLGGREFVFDVWTTLTHGRHVGYILITDYRASEDKELRLRIRMLKSRHYAKYTFFDIRGNSPAIIRCRSRARQFAGTKATVLITGESGTGKELFASAIHNESERASGPFIAINCGALVESLLESELFGYEGGAFTGARREGKKGLFELAHGGTLFLDEIGEMPQGLQVKLLRALQEREIVRVGGHDVIPVDVRIIAATNRNLKEQVEKGSFRRDLYYRLNVLPLRLPSLNERREDILPLFSYICDSEGYCFSLDAAAQAAITSHQYEGNVRELRNCAEYLGSLKQTQIGYDDLPDYMQDGKIEEPTGDSPSKTSIDDQVLWAIASLKSCGQAAGRRSITEFLRQTGKDFSEAQVRTSLKRLSEEKKISVGRGRKGISLI